MTENMSYIPVIRSATPTIIAALNGTLKNKEKIRTIDEMIFIDPFRMFLFFNKK